MTKAMEEARAIALKPANLMRAIEYALRHSPVVETTFSEEGDFDVEIHEPASLEAFATALVNEVAPEIIATALASSDALTAGEREPYGYVQHETRDMLSKYGTGHIRPNIHEDHGYVVPLYTSPPASELEAQLAERMQVKSLRWKSRPTRPADIFCDTDVGQYSIGNIHGTTMVILRRVKKGQDDDEVLWEGLDNALAKAAAQADFDRRILSALEATPPAPACETCNGTGNEARHSICRDCEEAAAPNVTDVEFRLLEVGETLQSDDEVVDDNGKSWVPVDRWAVGTPYSRAFKSVRRPLTAAQEAGKP